MNDRPSRSEGSAPLYTLAGTVAQGAASPIVAALSPRVATRILRGHDLHDNCTADRLNVPASPAGPSQEASMFARRCLAFAALVALHSVAARAQTVRGIVVDQADRPMAGVVVLLMDAGARIAARGLSNAHGEYRIVAAAPGNYTLRTLRIGFRPTVSDAVALVVGRETELRLRIANLPLVLDTIRIVDRSICRMFTDSGAATYAVWDQVRTALIAAQLTAASRTVAATTVSYERSLDPGPGRTTGHVLKQQSTVSTDYVSRAWRTLPPDSLRQAGYVVNLPDNSTVYYAPGLDMLLSAGFVEDHCFRLTTDPKRAGLLGIAFEPTPERKRTPEIRGTLWLDRATSQLQRLEFRYVNATRDQEEQAGGDLEFAPMRDGAWIISRWNIRMPVYQQVLRRGVEAELRLAEILVAGGELALARRGNDTLWAQPPLALRGVALDSISGSPLSGARVSLAGTSLAAVADTRGRFTVAGVLPGQYTAEVRTASLDSVNAVHRAAITVTDAAAPVEIRVPGAKQIATLVCGTAGARDSVSGIVLGGVYLRGDTTPAHDIKSLKVIGEWGAATADAAGAGDSNAMRVRHVEVRAARDGTFRLCRVPTNTAITLHATSDSAETADPTTIRIPSTLRLARFDLVLDRRDQLALHTATFTGVVVADSSREPIAGADVSLPDVAKSVRTDSRGAFTLVGIPPGEHQVVVRRIGYGAADTRVVFAGGKTIERRVVLGHAVVLEPITVSAKLTERLMRSFEENRALGLGHFMTRDELEKYTGMQLSSVLRQLPGVDFVAGRGSKDWITSRRAPASLCVPPGPTGTMDAPTHYGKCLISHGMYLPEPVESRQGMKVACYAQVYVDGVLRNGSRQVSEPFDVNEIAPERIEAIEFYSSPAQTPMEYSRSGSMCGVLVIWTRR